LEKSTKPTPSPFSEMLDSANPSADPPVKQTGFEHPTRTERPKPAKSSEDRPAETKPAGGSASATNGNVPARSDDAKTTGKSKDDKTADAGATASADSDGRPIPDQTASLDAPMTDTATTAAPVQPPVAAPPAAVVVSPLPLPTGINATEIDPSAELQAVKDPRVSPDATHGRGVAEQSTRTAPDNVLGGMPQTTAKPDKTADAQSDPTANASTALPQTESTGDAKPRSGDDKAAAEFHRTFAELTAAHSSADAPASDHRDGGTSGAAPANSAPATGVPIQSNTPAMPATAANPATAQAQAPAVAVPLAGLAIEIATQAHAGKNHFDIRLDPPELGRINVKLDVDRDGNVATRLVVDRSDTLDLLKRDASTLERALQQAGLKTSDHGLDFSLRQHAFAEQDTTSQVSATRVAVPDDDSAPLDALRQGYGRLLGLGGGLDIRV
jgi:flagellar hook-length control protein FliK